MTSTKGIFAVVGVGAIGSRHLQGICKLKFPSNVYAVDPLASSLAVAEQRVKEILTRGRNIDITVEYSTDLSILPSVLDVAVIATSSMSRLEALLGLLRHSRTKHVVLEKIAFPSRRAFQTAKAALETGKATAWVNCARRMNPAYQFLRGLIAGKNMRMKVAGKNYGLACNAIHFIDLFAFLTRSREYSMDCSGLIPKIFESKRPGYVELFGEIRCGFQSGNLILACENNPDQRVDFTITLSTERFELKINEIKGTVEVLKDPDRLLEGYSYKSSYQSDLTGVLVTDLLGRDSCDLTEFGESMGLHLTFIDGISDFYMKAAGKTVESVPIT